jgi:hypothetical protein
MCAEYSTGHGGSITGSRGGTIKLNRSLKALALTVLRLAAGIFADVRRPGPGINAG